MYKCQPGYEGCRKFKEIFYGDSSVSYPRKNIQEVIGAEKIVVYMHHRPFIYKAVGHLLQDRKELKKILKGKIDALLCGHRHRNKTFHGKKEIPRIYDGGTSTAKGGKKSPHMIIDLSVNPNKDIDGNFYE